MAEARPKPSAVGSSKQGAPSGRAASFGPKPKGPPKGKAAIARVLDAVREAYGTLPPPAPREEPVPVVEHAVYAVLARGTSGPGAGSALARLKQEFVDWNEVRLAEAFELEELFADVLPPQDLTRRCERLKALLSRIYQDQNRISLEPLREKTTEERAKYLAGLGVLSADEAHYVCAAMEGSGRLVFHYSSARVVQRLGLVERSGSPAKLAERTESLLAGRDTLQDQLALVWLGETVCHSKNPACKQCCVVRYCVSRKV